MNAKESCKCNVCSDNLVFSIAEGLLICPRCNAAYDIEGYDSERRNKGDSPQNAEPRPQDWTCPDCGGTVSAAVREFTQACPFCGTAITGPRPRGDELKPDIVIPFAKGREAFFQKFREYCVKNPFIPDDFSKSILPADIRPAYLPFFIYDAEAEGELKLREIGDKYHISHKISGDFSLKLKGLPEALAAMPLRDPSGQDRVWNLCLEPWDLAQARSFSSSWLCGLRDKIGDTPGAEILKAKKTPDYKDIKQRILKLCVRLLTRRSYRNLDSKGLVMTPRSIRYALFPVWLIPVRYHDKTYLSAMNASTGKTALYVPESLFKRLTAALSFAVFNAGFAMIGVSAELFCWKEPRVVPLAILGFVLFVPMLALICLICQASYFFSSKHLFRGNISLFLTSFAALIAGLMMSYGSVVILDAGSELTFPGFVAFLVFSLSFGLIRGGEKFIKNVGDDGLFKMAKRYGVTWEPDRPRMDKNYIDLRNSSAEGVILYEDCAERLPDPLEGFTPETYS